MVVGSVTISPTQCPAGTFSPTNGASSNSTCMAYPAGKAGAIEGSSTIDDCQDCQPGSFASSPGSQKCELCSSGHYQSWSDQSSCAVCGAGNYSSNILSCEPCQLREFCPEGATVGTRCPEDTTTVGRGASSVEDCGCFPGFVRSNTSCVACRSLHEFEQTEMTDCHLPGQTLETVLVFPGFWRQSAASLLIRKCDHPSACLGTVHSFGNVSQQCAVGHAGPLCDICADNFYGGRGAPCQRCEGNYALTIGLTIAGMLLALMITFFALLYAKRQAMAMLRNAHEHEKWIESIATKTNRRCRGVFSVLLESRSASSSRWAAQIGFPDNSVPARPLAAEGRLTLNTSSPRAGERVSHV